MSKIKEFYKTDGKYYKFRRWQKYPTGQFDFECTKRSIEGFLKQENFKNSLEVGCGPGTWTSLLKNHTQNLIAIDISETMISEAEKNIIDPNIQFLNIDINDFDSTREFNLIFSIRAFEYFLEKEKFIKKSYKMLDSNGKIFVITKTKISYWYGRTKVRKVLRRLFPFLFYYEDNEITESQIQSLSNFQQQRLSTTEFKKLLKKNGFENIKIKPVIIRPPIFMRGKSEIPIIPPLLEKPILALLKIAEIILSKSSIFTIFAESYSISGIKK